MFVPFKRMNMKRNFISNARYKSANENDGLVSSEIVYPSIVVETIISYKLKKKKIKINELRIFL